MESAWWKEEPYHHLHQLSIHQSIDRSVGAIDCRYDSPVLCTRLDLGACDDGEADELSSAAPNHNCAAFITSAQDSTTVSNDDGDVIWLLLLTTRLAADVSAKEHPLAPINRQLQLIVVVVGLLVLFVASSLSRAFKNGKAIAKQPRWVCEIGEGYGLVGLYGAPTYGTSTAVCIRLGRWLRIRRRTTTVSLALALALQDDGVSITDRVLLA